MEDREDGEEESRTGAWAEEYTVQSRDPIRLAEHKPDRYRNGDARGSQ